MNCYVRRKKMIVRFKEKAFFKSFFVICCRKRNKVGGNNIVNKSAIWFKIVS